MPAIPRDPYPDSTLALLWDGYEFIANRCRRYESDIFETRLLLHRAVCLHGAEATRLFYDSERFERHGAMPQRVLWTLLGTQGVQALDGAAHRHRKQIFMELLSGNSLDHMLRMTEDEWQSAVGRWERQSRVVLFDELQMLLCRAACRWAQVPLPEHTVQRRTDQMAAMIEAPAAIGPRHWGGLWARRQAERWIGGVVDDIRTGKLAVAADSPAGVVAAHRDLNGKLLDRHVAAVELLNLLRPIVAVARFVVFAALALHTLPEHRQQLRTGEDDYLELFVQEVRRISPFFPFVAAIAKQSFEWKGYHVPNGRWVILDLHGTNHDRRIWPDPSTFKPERFRYWNGSTYNFVPQGGGDYDTNHRCPGEQLTIALMKLSLRHLTGTVRYDVPPQDLRVSLRSMPTLPRSRFVIGAVQRTQR